MSAPPDRSERPDYVGFFPSLWLGGCFTLSISAEWVYLQISLYCMDKGEPVPPDDLPMILVRHPGWQADLDLLIKRGKVHRTNAGGAFVKRALVEYERAAAALLKRRKAGAKGAEARWGNSNLDAAANGDANGKSNADANGSRAEQSRADVDPSDTTGGEPDLLFSIEADTWAAFAEHRVKLKAPLTARAGTMIRNELLKIHEEHGHDPNAVLRQSVVRGWKGVFPLKDDGNGDGRRSGWRMPQ